MIYNIPLCNEELFLKKVKRIMNKCHNGEVVVLPMDTILVEDKDRKLKYMCRQYDVVGEYKIDGWEFIAEIEHKNGGNVIRCIKPEYDEEITLKYRDRLSTCEHCGKRLYRKNTFIVRNLETNEFKQVGSSCVKEYTRGLNAEVCADISSFFSDIEDIFAYSDAKCGSYSHSYVSTELILKLMYDQVKKFGYDKDVTRNFIIEKYQAMTMKEMDKLVSDKKIEEVGAWVDAKSKSSSSSYWCSCNALFNSSDIEYRDCNYLLSMFSIYFKEQMEILKNQKSKNNVYVGNVGDRITLKVAQVRCLYSKGSYSYRGPEVDVLEIIDEEGHTYIWSTSSYVKEGDTIKATIKAHKEYKGVKQTVITRGTFIVEEDKPKKQEYKGSSQEGLDLFLKYVEGDED